MLINVSIKTLSQGIEAIEKIYINSNIPHFQTLIQFGCSLNRKREHIVLTKEETEAFRIKLEPVIDKLVEDVKKEGIDCRKLVNKARKLTKIYEE